MFNTRVFFKTTNSRTCAIVLYSNSTIVISTRTSSWYENLILSKVVVIGFSSGSKLCLTWRACLFQEELDSAPPTKSTRIMFEYDIPARHHFSPLGPYPFLVEDFLGDLSLIDVAFFLCYESSLGHTSLGDLPK